MSASAETGLFLDGLHCAGCVNRVERALREAIGVEDAAVNYTTHRALVRFDPEATDTQRLVARVEELGFEATPFAPDALGATTRQDARRALVRLLVAAFFAGNVMVIAAALYIGASQGLDPATRAGLRWTAVALSLPAVTWCAAPFWRGMWNGLRERAITIDLPIVLGISAAFAANVAGTIAGSEHVYVDSAAMIVFLILLGRTLERGARSHATGAIERLTALTPPTALRIARDGTLEAVEARELAPGDRVRIAPGEVVPADGRLVAGSSEFDESLLTGEPVPVVRTIGDEAIGGSLNVLGEIDLEVTAGVDAGTLARLAALLERAQTQRPQVQQLADRIARVFAPSVLALAAATAVGWALAGASAIDVALAASAVLIVACPCALGLATPAAVTAAIGRAASLGILVKSGETLERCATVDSCVLDKTGTLTRGALSVVAVAPAAGATREAVLTRAAEAEGASLHPIAQAICRASVAEPGANDTAADESTREGWKRTTHAGLGVEARRDEQVLRVGVRDFVAAPGVDGSGELDRRAAELADSGATLAWVGTGECALGVIALVDELRADASDAMTALAELGLSTELVTGDHEAAARTAAAAAGLPAEAVHAAAQPEQKVERVTRLRAAGHGVVVVGDGINDAAALASADVGIAMATGSDVSLHAADIVIRAPRLLAVADTIGLSRATLRRIRENLGFALLYNAVAIPLAAAGILGPLHAAIAMGASSLVVTANATRLARWRGSRQP